MDPSLLARAHEVLGSLIGSGSRPASQPQRITAGAPGVNLGPDRFPGTAPSPIGLPIHTPEGPHRGPLLPPRSAGGLMSGDTRYQLFHPTAPGAGSGAISPELADYLRSGKFPMMLQRWLDMGWHLPANLGNTLR